MKQLWVLPKYKQRALFWDKRRDGNDTFLCDIWNTSKTAAFCGILSPSANPFMAWVMGWLPLAIEEQRR